MVEMKQFIEDMGILFEEMALPRMAGRIFGWLLMCEPLHQSAEELASVVGASKGSISSMTRLLIQSGVVERMGLLVIYTYLAPKRIKQSEQNDPSS